MNPSFPKQLLERIEQAGVVAGFSVHDTRDAVPITEALVAGDVRAIELTLRTSAGLDAIAKISEAVPEVLLGVGTILTPEQARAARDAGAQFGVAPGFNPRVVQAAADAGLPFAPGIATPSDLEAALELGCRFFKLFPAGPLGGVEYLQSLAAPYDHLGVRFFPLGGLNNSNLIEYLEEPSVVAIGGSWIVQKKLVENGDWAAITARAAETAALVSATRKGLVTGKGQARDVDDSCPKVETGD